MAILKKGSKGSSVKEVQTLVNKLGIKPQLNVDGIFGPLTEAGVRSAQKKLALDVDGAVGEFTLAALKYGKPLPVWEMRSLKGRAAKQRAQGRFHDGLAQCYLRISKQLNDLDKLRDKNDPKIKKALTDIKQPREAMANKSAEIEQMELEFDKILTKNPAAAQKLFESSKKKYKEFNVHYSAVWDNVGIMSDNCIELDDAVKLFSKSVETEMKAMKKVREAWIKELKDLNA